MRFRMLRSYLFSHVYAYMRTVHAKKPAKVQLFFDICKLFCKKIQKKVHFARFTCHFGHLNLFGMGNIDMEITGRQTFFEFLELLLFISEGTRL